VWWDAIHNKLTWNCGQSQMVGHLTSAVQCLKAAEIGSLTDPVAVDSGTDPFRWGEQAGAVTIDAVAFPEITGEMLEADRAWTSRPGDNITPVFMVPGRGGIIRTFDAAVTDTMLPQILAALYGTATPAVGTLPTSQPLYRALKTVYTRTAVTRILTYDTPKVELKPDDIVIGTKPQGGLQQLTFGGRAVKGGAAALTVTAKTADATSYITCWPLRSRARGPRRPRASLRCHRSLSRASRRLSASSKRSSTSRPTCSSPRARSTVSATRRARSDA
jgi:hypothetical protein